MASVHSIHPNIISPATFIGTVTRIGLFCLNHKCSTFELVPEEASKPAIYWFLLLTFSRCCTLMKWRSWDSSFHHNTAIEPTLGNSSQRQLNSVSNIPISWLPNYRQLPLLTFMTNWDRKAILLKLDTKIAILITTEEDLEREVIEAKEHHSLISMNLWREKWRNIAHWYQQI